MAVNGTKRVTRLFTKAQLEAITTEVVLLSAPGDNKYLKLMGLDILKLAGGQTAGTSRDITLQYEADTVALTTLAGVNAANGVLNAAGAAFDTSEPAAINAIALTAVENKGISIKLSGALTAATDTLVQVVVYFEVNDVRQV